jgi:predicted amidohydrolase YtcJ
VKTDADRPTLFLGSIFTATPGGDAAALVVGGDGHILYCGDASDDLLKAFQDRTVTLPPGSLVSPAFHDGHNHWGFAAFAGAADLSGARFSLEIQDVLRDELELAGRGWLLGYGWDSQSIGNLAIDELDEVSSERPIAVFDRSFHVVQLNTLAAEAVDKMRAATPGAVGRFDAGRVVEGFHLVLQAAEFDPATLRAALAGRQAHWLSLGIGSVDDLDLAIPAVAEALAEGYGAGELFLPCQAFLNPTWASRDFRIREAKGLHAVGLKLYADGTLGARTAAVSRPYEGSGECGMRLLDGQPVEELWKSAAAAGLERVAIHAIGDVGIDDAAETIGMLRRVDECLARPVNARIEHAEMPAKLDLDRIAMMEIGVSMQPNFLLDADTYVDRLGVRTNELCPIRSMIDAGITISFGSDGLPDGPAFGMRMAVSGPNEAERISAGRALLAYTRAAHLLAGTFSTRGSLEKGKEANFVVLRHDPRRSPDPFPDGLVMETWFRGKRVYRASG